MFLWYYDSDVMKIRKMVVQGEFSCQMKYEGTRNYIATLGVIELSRCIGANRKQIWRIFLCYLKKQIASVNLIRFFANQTRYHGKKYSEKEDPYYISQSLILTLTTTV